MVDVLVVGQTPPPFHGQAVMVDILLKGGCKDLKLHHVRMSFSRTVSEVGKFTLRKLWHQFYVIIAIVIARLKYGARVLYYVPGGPSRMPVYRDIIILLATRWMFQRLVFHIHACGISEYLDQQPRWLRSAYLLACGRPYLVIELSDFGPQDAQYLKAQKRVVIPNGLKDEFPACSVVASHENSEPVILFVGALMETKGIMVLLEASAILKQAGIPFRLDIVGETTDRLFYDRMNEYVAAHGLTGSVCFLGLRTGNEKNMTYLNSDVFCFPSFYPAEGMPLVVIEAMQFRLPVVATAWRGIQQLVKNNETGYLVPANDARMVAEKLAGLLTNRDVRRTMGEKARQYYLREFTDLKWRERMNAALSM